MFGDKLTFIQVCTTSKGIEVSALIISIIACGTNFQNTHYFAKSHISEGWNCYQVIQIHQNMLIYHTFKKINVCSKVFVEYK